MSTARQDEVWRRWRAGESFSAIARSLELPLQHVRRFLAQTGGVRRPPPQRRSQHLTMAEREEISRGLAAGRSARTIAVCLGRSPSTISREIARNGGRADYRAAAADHRAYQRARRPKPAKLVRNTRLRALVEEKLATCWSPEQIAGWLRRQFPGEESMRISHEAIYLTLFDPRRKAIDRTLTRRLRTRRPMRHPKRARPQRPPGRHRLRRRLRFRGGSGARHS